MLQARSALLAAFVAAALMSTSAVAGPPGSTVILTRPSGFGALTPPSVNDSSSDGLSAAQSFFGEAHPGRRLVGGPSSTSRYTVFASNADGLATDDNDSVENIYVRDGINDTTTLVSRASDGTPANGDSNEPAISADGHYAVFTSNATNLVPNVDPNGTIQVYRRDLLSGVTTLVSRANGGAGAVADDNSREPSVASDGTVAFSSIATNLGAPAGIDQVYVRVGTTNTLIASVQSGTTTPGNDDSFGPSISDDGNYVAFSSQAGNITAADPGHMDVFRYSVSGGDVDLASVRTISPNAGTYGNADSSGAAISSNGARVAFTSYATNFATLDADPGPDVYLHVFSGTPATALMSQGAGVKANGDSFDASISSGGTEIGFLTNATNLAAADTNGVLDAYVRDLNAVPNATTSLASRCQGSALLTSPAAQAAVSPSGSLMTFTTNTRGCSPQADDEPRSHSQLKA